MGRKYLLKKDSEDLRDLYYRAAVRDTTKLPPLVDLRSKMPLVFDQGNLGSCTANAGTAFREYLALQGGIISGRLSRLFLYWQERALEGTISQDAGAMLRDCMKSLQKIGVCPEVEWPYDITKFADTPSSQATNDAGQFRITEYHRVNTLNQLKAAMAAGLPIVYGFEVYESFENDQVAQTGMVPLPDKLKEQCLGGHAVLAVGYDDNHKCVITRNSWGPGWGREGYFFMPYAAFKKGSIVMDMWTGKI